MRGAEFSQIQQPVQFRPESLISKIWGEKDMANGGEHRVLNPPCITKVMVQTSLPAPFERVAECKDA